MPKVSNLLQKLSQKLFEELEDQEKFIKSLVQPQSFHPCILWCRQKPATLPFTVEPPLAWQPPFIDRLPHRTKPGKDPLHNNGYFYCLDFSSVFAASVVLTISQPINLVLDMCAAPGGKSIFSWQALHPKLLLSNEVIKKRTGILITNLKRCQIQPAVVFSLDSQLLAKLIPKTLQLVLVDAPCSGQSLLAKGGKAPGCFHPVSIKKNVNRQKRILANSAQLVAPQGYLAYMTCTYSPEENEGVSEWFIKNFPTFQPLVVPPLAAYQSHLTVLPSYRMWPQSGLGAGAFTILFQNTEEGEANSLPPDFLNSPGSTFI